MRILIVSQHFWPEEFRINDLVGEFRSRGFDVTVLTGWPNYPQGKIFPAFRENPEAFMSFEGATLVRVPLIPRGKAGSVRLFLNYLSFALAASTIGLFRTRRKRFDAVLVFMSSPPTQALPAVLLRIFKGIPALIWVQDLWPQSLSAVGAIRSPLILKAVGAFMSWLYRSADYVLIQSEAFRQDVEKRSGSRSQIRYLPNWSDPGLAEGLEGVAPAPELASFASYFSIMFAGNLGEAQDLPSIVKAAALCSELDDVRWLIVGEGRAREEAETLASQLGVGDRVVFLGRYPTARMPEFFSAADAMLVSLRSDPIFSMTIPSKIQSYMSAGRPIVGMLDGEGRRVLEESGAGMVAPAGDAEALANAVRAIRMLSPSARREMGERGRAYARAHFDRSRLVDDLVGWMKAAAAVSKVRR